MTSSEATRHRVSGSRGPDLPGPLPTRLPQDNQRLGSPTFLRLLIATRTGTVQIDQWSSPCGFRIGLGAYTAVPEYQPVVHRLRLSASP